MSRPGPADGDLAGRWLSKFLTSHLAAERDLSPQTIASYRDAIRLLLTWFRDVQATPPEKLRLADIDRARVLAFLDWLQAERGNSASTRNQRLAVIKSFARYTAIERPELLGQATQILAVRQQKTPAGDMGHLTGSEVKALLAEPDRHASDQMNQVWAEIPDHRRGVIGDPCRDRGVWQSGRIGRGRGRLAGPPGRRVRGRGARRQGWRSRDLHGAGRCCRTLVGGPARAPARQRL